MSDTIMVGTGDIAGNISWHRDDTATVGTDDLDGRSALAMVAVVVTAPPTQPFYYLMKMDIMLKKDIWEDRNNLARRKYKNHHGHYYES